jgi:hypothetical protein
MLRLLIWTKGFSLNFQLFCVKIFVAIVRMGTPHLTVLRQPFLTWDVLFLHMYNFYRTVITAAVAAQVGVDLSVVGCLVASSRVPCLPEYRLHQGRHLPGDKLSQAPHQAAAPCICPQLNLPCS